MALWTGLVPRSTAGSPSLHGRSVLPAPRWLQSGIETPMAKKPTPDAAEVQRLFDWDDPATYQWVVRDPEKSIRAFALRSIRGSLTKPIVMYLILWLISFASQAVAFWLGVAHILIALPSLVLWNWLAGIGKPGVRVMATYFRASISIAAVGTIAYVLSSPASFLRGGFEGDVDSLSQWLLFFADNLFSVFLLDIPEVFHLKLSGIEPGAWYAGAATVLFRLSMVLGVVDYVWMVYRSEFQEQRHHCTVSDFWNVCVTLPDPKEVVFRREGKVETASHSELIVPQDFIDAFREEANRPEE